MAFFDKFKKKAGFELAAPVAGECVDIAKVNDPTFSEEILGKGIAVIPSDNQITAPADGTISTVFHTMHAVTMLTDFGAEILIHIGLDTVNLEGRHFSSKVKEGDKVKTGDVLVTFDREEISKAGYDTITPMVICNSAEFQNLSFTTGKNVSAGENVITLEKK